MSNLTVDVQKQRQKEETVLRSLFIYTLSGSIIFHAGMVAAVRSGLLDWVPKAIAKEEIEEIEILVLDDSDFLEIEPEISTDVVIAEETASSPAAESVEASTALEPVQAYLPEPAISESVANDAPIAPTEEPFAEDTFAEDTFAEDTGDTFVDPGVVGTSQDKSKTGQGKATDGSKSGDSTEGDGASDGLGNIGPIGSGPGGTGDGEGWFGGSPGGDSGGVNSEGGNGNGTEQAAISSPFESFRNLLPEQPVESGDGSENGGGQFLGREHSYQRQEEFAVTGETLIEVQRDENGEYSYEITTSSGDEEADRAALEAAQSGEDSYDNVAGESFTIRAHHADEGTEEAENLREMLHQQEEDFYRAETEPAYEDSAYKEPVYEEPVYEEPVYEEPVYEEPAYKEPVYEEPVYEEPVYEEPAYKEPVYEEPVYEEPVYEEPVYEEPVYEKPIPGGYGKK
ncbi:hypothetical protein IQ235_07715 [Oscillatoriales cyanobacterium LEGE 11467]|uniref:Uncharacterized protein n=1 Tax=Zarconia navalis LEGE 11467 TaxID=1828826 RepID=A0A928VYL3_9CYAN|nr:hypothetical protein [Zarconia navalis]MBE9040666.1 hypothetical protein [Zarconia navalis LEGE 11467]